MREYDRHIGGEFQELDGDDTIPVTDPYDREV